MTFNITLQSNTTFKCRLLSNGVNMTFSTNNATLLDPILGIPFVTAQTPTTNVVDFSKITQVY